MLLQHRVHDFALHADAAAVDDPDLTKASFNRLIQVLFDHNPDFPRLESVQIDEVFDRNLVHDCRGRSVAARAPAVREAQAR